MKVGRSLRRAVLARIAAEVTDLGGRVFDRAVAGTQHPYCTLGPSDWSPRDADCIEGRLYALQLDIWHSAAAKGALEDLVDDVAASLRELEVQEIPMHPFRVALARIMDDPSGDLHGVVQIEALIEGG